MNILELIEVELSFIPTFMLVVINIMLLIIGAIILYNVIKHTISHVIAKKSKSKTRHYQKRAETIRVVVLNIAKYLVSIITFILILSTLGVDVGTLVAGLGIAGFLVGLAFQDIARDFIAGISIVAEDQYEIGDVVEIGGFKGEVTFVGLRTTRLRNLEGATRIISNSRVTDLINYNLHNALAVVDLRFPFTASPTKIEKVLEEVSKTATKKIPKAKGEIKVLGIEEMDNTSLTYRVAVEVSTSARIEAERILRRELKLAIDKTDINV